MNLQSRHCCHIADLVTEVWPPLFKIDFSYKANIGILERELGRCWLVVQKYIEQLNIAGEEELTATAA